MTEIKVTPAELRKLANMYLPDHGTCYKALSQTADFVEEQNKELEFLRTNLRHTRQQIDTAMSVKLDYIEKLSASISRNNKLEVALKYYADGSHQLFDEDGQLARAALEVEGEHDV